MAEALPKSNEVQSPSYDLSNLSDEALDRIMQVSQETDESLENAEGKFTIDRANFLRFGISRLRREGISEIPASYIDDVEAFVAEAAKVASQRSEQATAKSAEAVSPRLSEIIAKNSDIRPMVELANEIAIIKATEVTPDNETALLKELEQKENQLMAMLDKFDDLSGLPVDDKELVLEYLAEVSAGAVAPEAPKEAPKPAEQTADPAPAEATATAKDPDLEASLKALREELEQKGAAGAIDQIDETMIDLIIAAQKAGLDVPELPADLQAKVEARVKTEADAQTTEQAEPDAKATDKSEADAPEASEIKQPTGDVDSQAYVDALFDLAKYVSTLRHQLSRRERRLAALNNKSELTEDDIKKADSLESTISMLKASIGNHEDALQGYLIDFSEGSSRDDKQAIIDDIINQTDKVSVAAEVQEQADSNEKKSKVRRIFDRIRQKTSERIDRMAAWVSIKILDLGERSPLAAADQQPGESVEDYERRVKRRGTGKVLGILAVAAAAAYGARQGIDYAQDNWGWFGGESAAKFAGGEIPTATPGVEVPQGEYELPSPAEARAEALVEPDFTVESGHGYTHEIIDTVKSLGGDISVDQAWKLHRNIADAVGSDYINLNDFSGNDTYSMGPSKYEVGISAPGKAQWDPRALEMIRDYVSSSK